MLLTSRIEESVERRSQRHRVDDRRVVTVEVERAELEQGGR
jgi:hypothetical protein